MYRKAHPLFLICNTPTHVGSGSELGVVDLPIQRERHTGFPKFEASSLKGSLREAFEREKANELSIHRLFGYDSDSASSNTKEYFNKKEDQQFAGALGFTDARLLLFPVKSMKGVFAWITCLRALKQFQGDMQLVSPGFTIKDLDEKSLSQDSQQTYLFNPSSNVRIPTKNGDKIILEEYTFTVDNELNGFLKVQQNGQSMDLPDWLAKNLFDDDGSYWSEKLKKDIVVLPDDDFKDFVNLSTEVITRTKIDNNTGTVAQGALFNEEYLPAESILYSLALTAAEFKEKDRMEEPQVFEFLSSNLKRIKTIQIGGNATLGKGIVTTKLLQL
jgi:CRISPR-associated protein Cmr4